MHLANDGTELIISDVCKNCADGSSDLQVIQCNASNVHGYAFGEGYINILGNEINSITVVYADANGCQSTHHTAVSSHGHLVTVSSSKSQLQLRELINSH